MDVSFNNVLEGTRQYFMGLPKASPSSGGGQAAWPALAPPPSEGAPARSGAPARTSRPPSAAAAPPPPTAEPLEPLEPEPHIIHKATVMREALEKRRERTDHDAPSPHDAPPHHDRYLATQHYRYEGDPVRHRHAPAAASPQPTAPRPSSQQTYARMSGSMPHHASTARLRDATPPTQRYSTSAPPPPQNDRVPPIHHPAPSPHRATAADGPPSLYPPHRRPGEAAAYARLPTHYDRAPSAPRKYDIQQAYPGYRPAQSVPQPIHEHRTELPHTSQLQYKHLIDAALAPHYPSVRTPGRSRPPEQARPADAARPPVRQEYATAPRTDETRAGTRYYYPGPPSAVKATTHNPSVPVPVTPPAPQRSASYRSPQMPKSSYEYTAPAGASQTSPARAPSKSNFANQQSRMTVSVTSLVNQMNQTKQKRESPLDLSVKTVKNSADSSTAQEDADSSSVEPKIVPHAQRPPSAARQPPVVGAHGYVSSHKVDFSPDFHSQYRDRSGNLHRSGPVVPPGPTAPRYNGYEARPRSDTHLPAPQHPPYVESEPKYGVPKHEHSVPRIDLTRPTVEERHVNRHNNIRDDRSYIVDDARKRLGGPIVSNIPEKLVRYETWCSDSRIERLSHAAREQHELMSRPVYSYSSHKRIEAYHSEQKRSVASSYRDNKYPYQSETFQRDLSEYHNHYGDRHKYPTDRNVIQKHPTGRELPQHFPDHNGVPANKRVLSILRNSLETKQSGFVEPPRPSRQIPDLIVIDDADDPVIEITDLTKDNEIVASSQNNNINLYENKSIHLPKAIDSIVSDTECKITDENASKVKSPENDVAARIRTKAELKVMPPNSHETVRLEIKQENKLDNGSISGEPKILPKSQKQHLFNQIREDNLRKESEKIDIPHIPEIKSEPMNIDEIEKDAEKDSKQENILEDNQNEINNDVDLDWANACDSFVEQLKTSCPKKKTRRSIKSLDVSKENNDLSQPDLGTSTIVIKQEPMDEVQDIVTNNNNTGSSLISQEEDNLKLCTESHVSIIKTEKIDVMEPIKIKEEPKEVEYKTKNDEESTDDDEPLIKSKILKEKEKKSEQMKSQLLKDLSEKSAYVKLECCDDLTKSNKREMGNTKATENKSKVKTSSKSKNKSGTKNSKKLLTSSDSDSDEISLTSRLRTRKSTKSEDNKPLSTNKTTVKSPLKKQAAPSTSSVLSVRKHGFGDGSDFHPGWEEELYRYKRSLRMPARLIAIPRGRSNGPPFARNTTSLFNRGSTSLPDLDPTPLSPAPSLAPSAATDDLIARRQDKIPLDSDLESNSSFSILNRLQYDSEASTSTFSSSKAKAKAKRKSIIDVLIQKCSEVDKRKSNEDDKKTKDSPNTDSKDKTKNKSKGDISKDKVKDQVKSGDKQNGNCNLKSSLINNNDSKSEDKKSNLKMKSRTRTDSKQLKQRMLEMFGDDRPASAPPSTCPEEDTCIQESKKKVDEVTKPKPKNKKIIKDKFNRRPSSIRDGLRSTSLKRSDAKGRLLRLKKRNNIINSLANKKIREFAVKKKEQKSPSVEEKETPKSEQSTPEEPVGNKKRFKRLFGRRKLSSGFDYIRKKKKIIKKDVNKNKIRKIVAKPTPESEDDILKEIKGWFINKSIGETSLHRATRLGYMDCVAYCLEKLDLDPSSKDNAGFTPLHVAAARGNVPIARLLLKYGANVSAAAQGGIRPLHEACENCHVEVIRLLLSYGADPLLGTYAGQTPTELAEGPAARYLRLHIADVQGKSIDPWQFIPSCQILDLDKIGCDPLSSPPPASPPPPEGSLEIQCTEAPLPPFYSLRGPPGQPVDGLWCLLQDITAVLQIKSKDSLLKQIHCGSGSPKELLRELRTQDFLERAQCHQFLGAGEKVNVRASKVALVRVTDKLRQLLKIETVLIS